MTARPEIPFELRDELLKEMPDYLKGRLDEIERATTSRSVWLSLFLVFVLPFLISRTQMGEWLAEHEVASLAFMACLIGIAWQIIEKWSYHARWVKESNIILLRVKLREWPSLDRSYPKTCYASDADIQTYLTTKTEDTADTPPFSRLSACPVSD